MLIAETQHICYWEGPPLRIPSVRRALRTCLTPGDLECSDIDHFRGVEEEPSDYDAVAAKKMAKYDAAHGWHPM